MALEATTENSINKATAYGHITRVSFHLHYMLHAYAKVEYDYLLTHNPQEAVKCHLGICMQ